MASSIAALALLASCSSPSAPSTRGPGQSVASPYAASCASPGIAAPCYNALQLEEAYDLKPLYAKGLDGMGTTVVVLAGKSPATLGSDLRAFDQAFHLPALKFSVV